MVQSVAYCVGARDMTIIREIVMNSQWIIAVLALYVVAWTRFNSPPTNRSGTTFALFFFGVTFYYALIVALWVLVMIGLVQGSIGFDWIGKALTTVNPEAQIQLAQYAPIVAALIIVSGSVQRSADLRQQQHGQRIHQYQRKKSVLQHGESPIIRFPDQTSFFSARFAG